MQYYTNHAKQNCNFFPNGTMVYRAVLLQKVKISRSSARCTLPEKWLILTRKTISIGYAS